jgi:UbiD family decarboxylase
LYRPLKKYFKGKGGEKMYQFKSLRDWLTFLEQKGDLVQNNEEVSIDGDITVISKKIARTQGPAIIHNNIQGYPGWRVHTDGLTTRARMLWALNIGTERATQVLAEKIETMKPLKPEKIDNGPCKEIKVFGDDVDLSKIPNLLTGEFQTTPYITAGISFSKDPETGWTNSAIRRFQVVGKDELCVLIIPTQHEGMIFSKYKDRKEPMPVSIVIGADPLVYIACNMPAAEQFDEMDYWGALAGEPLQVVKSETNDIWVPATAEIILEGEVSYEERRLEGPFPEFTGFYSGFRKCPVIKIKAVTMRHDPIYQDMALAPPSEGLNLAALVYGVEIYRQVKPLVPAISDVAVLSMLSLTTAVSVNKTARERTPGLARKLAMAIKAVKGGSLVKNLFIVDDDIDVHSIDDILWALSTKFQAAKDVTVVPDMPGLFLDPSEMWVGHGGKYSGHTSLGIFDCTEKPAPYNEGYRRGLCLPSRESNKRIGNDWAKYGFKEGR